MNDECQLNIVLISSGSLVRGQKENWYGYLMIMEVAAQAAGSPAITAGYESRLARSTTEPREDLPRQLSLGKERNRANYER